MQIKYELVGVPSVLGESATIIESWKEAPSSIQLTSAIAMSGYPLQECVVRKTMVQRWTVYNFVHRKESEGEAVRG